MLKMEITTRFWDEKIIPMSVTATQYHLASISHRRTGTQDNIFGLLIYLGHGYIEQPFRWI